MKPTRIYKKRSSHVGDSDMDDSNLEPSDSLTGLAGHSKQSLMRIWGSTPDVSARASFDMFVRDFFDLPPPYGVRLPSGVKSVYCYFFDIDTGLFCQWDTLLPQVRLMRSLFYLKQSQEHTIIPCGSRIRSNL